jgi:hypothetical protein
MVMAIPLGQHLNVSVMVAPRYCTVGSGKKLYSLASLENSTFPDQFGLPGSGHQRCSQAGDVLGGLKVRA